VDGTHIYAEEGCFSFCITVSDLGGETATITGTAEVADAPLSGVSTATATGGVEGTTAATLSGATFSDANTAASSSDFTVSAVDWGDGSSDTTGLTVSGSGGNYCVDGTHIYAEEGCFSFSIAVSDAGGETATITGTAEVADAPLSGVSTATATDGVEGTTAATLSGTTFSDANTAASSSDFTVSAVDWGDGSSDTTGLIVSGSGGSYSVDGTHLYAEEGSYNFSITVSDVGGETATITGTTTVSDPAVVAVGGFTLSAVEGSTSGSQSLATFTDPGGAEALADYSADIDWGDGSSATSGSISFNAGVFTVQGQHTYAEDGSQAITVTIHHDTAPDVVVSSSAVVAEGAILGTGVPVSGFEFTRLDNVPVANFTHSNGTDLAGQFTVSIDWGDGATSAGTVSVSGTTYTVLGSHTYQDERTYAIVVTVSDDSASATIGSQAVVQEELLPDGTRGTSDQRFISEVYRDLLGRGVDIGGLAVWTASLAAGESRSEVVSAIEASAEFQGHEVQLLYQRYLHRVPDAGALQHWSAMLAAGSSFEQVAALIVGSPEYFAFRGQGTNDGFLDAFYQDALGRAPDPMGRASLDFELSVGVSRADVARQIFASPEYKQKVVQFVFESLLDRQADPTAQEALARALETGVTDEQLITLVAASDEYFAKTAD